MKIFKTDGEGYKFFQGLTMGFFLALAVIIIGWELQPFS